MDHAASGRPLQPLAYHDTVVDHLKRHEPDVWRWAQSQTAQSDYLDRLRTGLLRDTYRLESHAHPDVHASLQLAMQRLGIHMPATLYQAGGSEMNASLVFVPGEIHVVLQGPMLERLTQDERTALLGHELAHHVLWSLHDGAYLAADRILNDAVGAHGAANSHRETLRRFALHTELFADRGAAIAAAAIEPAITVLVKTHTGITDPDPAAYLRQAAEIDAAEGSASAGNTHPETFLRARALDAWWRDEPGFSAWLAARLQGPLALGSLDLPGQVVLATMARDFLSHYLHPPALRSEAALTQVHALFPDWSPAEAASLSGKPLDDSLQVFFCALMLDVALADDEARDALLERAATVSGELGSWNTLQLHLKRDARLGKREIDRLGKFATGASMA